MYASLYNILPSSAVWAPVVDSSAVGIAVDTSENNTVSYFAVYALVVDSSAVGSINH